MYMETKFKIACEYRRSKVRRSAYTSSTESHRDVTDHQLHAPVSHPGCLELG